jgi:hypothetical protein
MYTSPSISANHLLKYHLLKYHALKMVNSESGAELVDRERKEFLALKEMGVNVDDSLRLTKFIQDKTTNAAHKQLAQTIFSTPQMTLDKATNLFETYHPSSSTNDPSVSVITQKLWCKYCKRNGHSISDCSKKKANDKKKSKSGRGNNKDRSEISSVPDENNNSKKRHQRFPCGICDSTEHQTHACPLKSNVRKLLKESGQNGGNWGGDDKI